MTEGIIEKAAAYVRELFAGNAGGHDAAHTFRVYRTALGIAENEPGADREIVALAALLHDADDHKLFQTEENANARRFLEENGVPAERIARILEVINSVSFSRNQGRIPETLEGKIVQDADRLDAMGAVGIARTFAYGGEHGRALDQSVQHFYDKLLRLRETMNTGTAKRLAEKRHRFLESFLNEYVEETKGEQALKKVVSTEQAPKAIGPYSQAIETDGLIFVSGQLPLDPATGVFPEGIEAQTRQSLTNARAILEAAGLGMANVVKTTVFLKDMNDFAQMNAVYAEFFPEGGYPARSAVEVARLPKDASVEIEVIAAK